MKVQRKVIEALAAAGYVVRTYNPLGMFYYESAPRWGFSTTLDRMCVLLVMDRYTAIDVLGEDAQSVVQQWFVRFDNENELVVADYSPELFNILNPIVAWAASQNRPWYERVWESVTNLRIRLDPRFKG